MNEEFLEFKQHQLGPFILQPYELEVPLPSKNGKKILHAKDQNTLRGYKYLFNTVYRKNPKRIFEIGVFLGGSLPLWGSVFPGATVVGIDINLKQMWGCAKEYIDTQPNLHAVQCNAIVKNKVTQVVKQKLGGKIDIVIDDGQHNLDTILPTFETLWPMVAPGGLYIIEDWLALGRPHRNEVLDKLHFMLESEWFKRSRKPDAPRFVGALRNTIVIQKVE